MLFVKEKKGEDPRTRWYASEATILELGLGDDEKLKEIERERLNVVLQELQK